MSILGPEFSVEVGVNDALKRCEYCVHWRKIRNEDYKTEDGIWPGPHGECNLIVEFDEIVSQKAWLSGIDGVEDDISLITKPDFSCMYFYGQIEPSDDDI